jgi:single-stranded DNA-binding protein
MSKNVKNKNKDYALVSLSGTITFSDIVRYDDNKKEIHNYFIMICEKYKDKDGNEKERKYTFKATQFDLKKNAPIFEKGDRVKISGFLKVNSYKNDDDEWVNQPYVMIKKIDYAE